MNSFIANTRGTLITSLMMAMFMPSAIFAQGDNPLESAQQIPPHFMSHDQREISLASVEWQIQQASRLLAHYESNRNSIAKSIDELDEKLLVLKNSVEPEIRMMDSSVRSQLIGKAMEKLLDSELELAALEKSVSILERKMAEKSSSKINALRQSQSDLEAAMAEKRYSLAQAEFKKMERLRKTNSISDNQIMRAQVSAEIAKLELRSVQNRGIIKIEESKMQDIARLSDHRIEIAPIKSRIQAIEKFLKKFSDANSASSKIEQFERDKALWEKDRRMVAVELFELHSKMQQLKSLQSLIKKQNGMNEKNDK